jgi:predicted nuclease of predicted toxin-antitoxin system
VSVQLKPLLAALGHDAATTADEGLLSRPDGDIATAAAVEGRMIFTLDVAFADLRKHPPGGHPGILLFRPATFGPLAVNAFIIQVVKGVSLDDLSGCVAVAEPGRIRVRRPAR